MMISRSSTKLLAEIYGYVFRHKKVSSYDGSFYYEVDNDELYGFLFERDYNASFLNGIKRQRFYTSKYLERFIMQIHTGESLEVRMEIRQEYLRKLAEDIIEYCETNQFYGDIMEEVARLKSKLELDGYI